MSKTPRSPALRLLAGIILAALPGLCVPQTPPKPIVLNVWGIGQSPDDKGMADAIREYEKRRPHVRVRALSMGVGGMNPQKLMTAIVGGVPPDVVHEGRFTISDWAARGAFRPLDDLIERDRASQPDITPTPDQYYPAVWAEAAYEGKQYGIPIATDSRALYWSKTVFREKASELRAAGLDPTRPPRTWSETLAYAKVLTEMNPDGTIKRAGFLPNFGNSWLYLYAFQMNTDFITKDGRRSTLNTPGAVKAIEFMREGYDIVGGLAQADRFVSTLKSGEDDPFLKGQVAMVINGNWTLGGYLRYRPGFDFGVSPAPVPDDRFLKRGAFKNEKDTFITWGGGWAYVIPRGAKHVDEGWEFIKWMTSLESRKLQMESQQAFEQARGRRFLPYLTGHISANNWAIKRFASGPSAFDLAVREHIRLLHYARIRPTTFAGQALWDAHVRAADRAIRGLDPPEKALADGDASVQRVLDEHLKASEYQEIDPRTSVFLTLGLAGILIGGGLLWIRQQKMKPLAKHEWKWGMIFISPWLIGFMVFTLGPMVASLFFSFTQYNILTEARWVGLHNYSLIFNEDRDLLFKAFFNIIYLAGLGVPLGMAVGLGVAMLLNQDIKGMRFFRTAFFLPSIVPGVASIILWLWILSTDPGRGIINYLWQHSISIWFSSQPPSWMGEAYWTKPAMILMGLWGAGSGMILWLAGLKGIPRTLYEAAEIDGATPRQQFGQITLPMLSPLIFFNLVMGFIGSIQVFDSIYIITGGTGAGANDSLMTPVYHLFTNAFTYFRMGYASALAWVIFGIILIITAIQFKLSKRWVHSEVQQ